MNKRFNTTRRDINTVSSTGSCSPLIKCFFFVVISFRSDAIYRVRSTLNLPLPWSSVIMEVNGGELSVNQRCVCIAWPCIRAPTGLELLIDRLSPRLPAPHHLMFPARSSDWFPVRALEMGGLALANGARGLPEGDLEGAAAGGESQFPGPPNPGAHFLGSLHSRGGEEEWWFLVINGENVHCG